MSILWAGTSLSDVKVASNGVVETTAGMLAPNALEGIRAVNTGRWVFPDFSPLSEIWVSEFAYFDAMPFSMAGWLYLNGPNMSNRFRLAMTSDRQIVLQVWRSSNWAWLTSATTLQYNADQRYRFDLHCKFAASEGFVELFIDGASHIRFDGNTAPADGNNITSIAAAGVYATNSEASGTVHSALIVSDEDTRPLTFIQRLPNGNGDHTDWTGGYADVDETGVNDADLITTSTTGAMESFTFPALPGSEDTRQLETLILAARTRGDGTPEVLQALARVGSTDYTASPLYERSAIYQAQQWQFPTNPATGSRWTGTQINGAQFGVKAAS